MIALIVIGSILTYVVIGCAVTGFLKERSFFHTSDDDVLAGVVWPLVGGPVILTYMFKNLFSPHNRNAKLGFRGRRKLAKSRQELELKKQIIDSEVAIGIRCTHKREIGDCTVPACTYYRSRELTS